jgi:hypothetical protein
MNSDGVIPALARGTGPRDAFMQYAHHYLILCRESYMEVVAWEFTWEVISDSHEQQ